MSWVEYKSATTGSSPLRIHRDSARLAIWREHAYDIERLCDEYAVEVGARDADDLVLFCFKSPQPEHYLSLAAFEIARELLAELPS